MSMIFFRVSNGKSSGFVGGQRCFLSGLLFAACSVVILAAASVSTANASFSVKGEPAKEEATKKEQGKENKSDAGNWPNWRGPQYDGHTAQKGFPQKWDDNNVLWKTPLKGEGQSSPVIWGNRVFLTAAIQRGKQRLLLAIDRTNGQILWEKVVWSTQGKTERSHTLNGWASATCATDGKHVYAFFGNGGGIFCYTVDGKFVWKKALGNFSEGGWGTAASPVLVGDFVIQNCDSDNDAYLIALHKQTGKVVWKTNRPNHRGWSTPILIQATVSDTNSDVKEVRDELVLNGHDGVRAYNPKTGKELWFCKGSSGRGEPTVTPCESGLLHVVCGRGSVHFAIKPGGNGTVTKSHTAWRIPRPVRGRDLPSPIAIGKYLMIVNMQGILTCHDTATGKSLSKIRLGGKFIASPIACNGNAIFINEGGEVIVIQPADKPKILHRNKIKKGKSGAFRSTITPSNTQLFIRSTKALYCIGKPKANPK